MTKPTAGQWKGYDWVSWARKPGATCEAKEQKRAEWRELAGSTSRTHFLACQLANENYECCLFKNNTQKILAWKQWHVGFEICKPVVMQISVFWDVTRCIPFEVNRHFGRKIRLHLQNSRERRIFVACFMLILLDLFFNHEYGGDIRLRNVGWYSPD